MQTLKIPALILALAGLLLSACGGSSSGVLAVIPPPQGPDYFYEIEPNDTPFTADFIQFTDSFTDSIIEGSLDGGPPGLYDTYDHFAFRATQAAEFVFELHPSTQGADLAIGVLDPLSGVFVGWWDSPFDVEIGSFIVHEGGTDFQIVVHSPTLGSDYSLDLFGFPFPFAPGDLEPGQEDAESPERDAPRISADPFGAQQAPSQAWDSLERSS